MYLTWLARLGRPGWLARLGTGQGRPARQGLALVTHTRVTLGRVRLA